MSTLLAPETIITDEQKRLYDEEGYMILKRVIPEETLVMLREECSYFLGYMDSIMDAEAAKKIDSTNLNHRGKRYFISNRYRLSTRMAEFIFSPLMADITRATLGPDAYLFHEQWVIKGAEQGMKFAWHQDSGYVKSGDKETNHKPYLTCWCTLDDVSEENGTVYLLPHSRGGTKRMVFDHDRESGSNDLVGYKGEDPGIPVVAPAGSIVAFTSYNFHRSGANTSKRMRRIYLPQYSSEPIQKGRPFGLAVPFLKDGEIVYNREEDMAKQ